MNNIHIIPTEKPSRLTIRLKTNELMYSYKEFVNQKYEDISLNQNQHIYITNDEEIKEGDWCFYLNNLGGGNIVCQAYKHSEDKRMLFDNGKHNRKIGEGITPLMGECKKIILTTDQDLIKDGVQAIDDDFLQWFVNNTSCEGVPIIPPLFGHPYIIWIEGLSFKKEPKQIKCYCGHTITCDCEPLQETLEEAALKFVENTRLKNPISIFCEGAKWQAERMFSEEDLRRAMITIIVFDRIKNSEDITQLKNK